VQLSRGRDEEAKKVKDELEGYQKMEQKQMTGGFFY
jgi:hypothetical protein